MTRRRPVLAVLPLLAITLVIASSLPIHGRSLLDRFGRPPGYETIEGTTSLVHFPLNAFPLRFYSTDERFDPLVHHAIDQWNDAARAAGIDMCYQEVPDQNGADFVLDWDGRELPSSVLGATHYTTGLISATLHGITMRGYHHEKASTLEHALMQEMGHALGLGHSHDRRDIMYDRVYENRWSHYTQVSLTRRDRQMLRWLYSQSDFVAFRTGRAAQPAVLIEGGGTRLFDI
jgi:hypothetical protein